MPRTGTVPGSGSVSLSDGFAGVIGAVEVRTRRHSVTSSGAQNSSPAFAVHTR